MAYALTDPLTPSDLYVSRTDGSGEQHLTSFNDEWLLEVDLVPAERLTWTVEDGAEIEGWLIKPVGYTPGQKYPLILKIHGGPHGLVRQLLVPYLPRPVRHRLFRLLPESQRIVRLRS